MSVVVAGHGCLRCKVIFGIWMRYRPGGGWGFDGKALLEAEAFT